MSKENEKQIDEEQEDIEKKVREDEERHAQEGSAMKTDEHASFAEEEQKEKKESDQPQDEDLSMFEMDLKLPDEGAMCVDTNLQAAKYMLVHLMNRVNRSIATWWKYNINTDRKGKIELWNKGYRPDVSGGGYTVKPIDPQTLKPEALTDFEYLQKLQANKGNLKTDEGL